MGDWLDIETQSNLQYVFLPENSGAVNLEVKAANDSHIALTDGPFESNPMTEIRIGGWNNTKSTIRRNQTKPDKVELLTPDILNATEYISFWIQWHDNRISAGLKNKPAFIKFLDPNPHPITHIAVRTGWGAVGSWRIQVSPILLRSLPVKPLNGGQLRWVTKTPNEELPLDAFIGGYENGETLYIGRVLQHHGLLVVGKYARSHKHLVVGWCRRLRHYDRFEILCGYNASWVPTNGGLIPPHAFVAGYENSESYFIGRGRINDDLIPGKVLCTHNLCYIPYRDTEVDMPTYEILVLPEKLPSAVVWRPRHHETLHQCDYNDNREEFESDGSVSE